MPEYESPAEDQHSHLPAFCAGGESQPDSALNDHSYTGGSKRDGCLFAWLVFLLIGQVAALGLCCYKIGLSLILGIHWRLPIPVQLLIIIGVCANIACLIALFRWRRWGFFGMFAVGAAFLFINIFALGMKPFSALVAFSGVVILYWTLRMGGQRSGWRQLR